MSVLTRNQVAYGLSQALINEAPLPIIALRNPAAGDRAPLGTLWINKTLNDAFVLTSIVNNAAVWTVLSGAAGIFNSIALPNTSAGFTQGFISFGGTQMISNFGTRNFFLGAAGNATLSTASDNQGLGNHALSALTTGNLNVGIGTNALTALTTGSNNIAIGDDALQGITTSADNTAVGVAALGLATSGSNNSAFGFSALGALLTGGSNTAVGANAGINYVGAEANNIVINDAGKAGESNAFRVGIHLVVTNTLALTFLGYNSGNVTLTGSNAVGIGTNALNGITSAVGATAVGYNAGVGITSGGFNTLVGAISGASLTSGTDNTAVGYAALNGAVTTTNNTALGYIAATLTTGNNNTVVGSNAGALMSTGHDNTLVGYQAGQAILTGAGNIIIGSGSGTNYVGAESANILIGNTGVALESDVIRIGTVGLQTECIIAGTVYATADSGAGIATTTGITNVVNTTQGAGTLVVKSTTGNPGNNAGFLKIYIGATVAYLPYWTNIAP